MPIVLPTPGFAGHGVQFSPFDERRVAIAGGQHFGIVGNGRLFVAAVDPVVGAQVLSVYDSQEGLYDVAWSENNNNQLVCGSADGSVRLIDTTLPVLRNIIALRALTLVAELSRQDLPRAPARSARRALESRPQGLLCERVLGWIDQACMLCFLAIYINK